MDFECKYIDVSKLIELKLVPEQKEDLSFRFKKKLSFKEIALIQRVNINTVLGRYRYAINSFRIELKYKL